MTPRKRGSTHEPEDERLGLVDRVKRMLRAARLVWTTARAEAELRKQDFRDRLAAMERDAHGRENDE